MAGGERARRKRERERERERARESERERDLDNSDLAPSGGEYLPLKQRKLTRPIGYGQSEARSSSLHAHLR